MADGFVERGIGLTTIGVGSDFDVQLMRGLAEHGAGNFYFLEDASAATEVFKQELDFFVSPLALDININAVAGVGYNFGEVVGSTLWNASTKAGSMHIPAAFVASRTGPAPDPGTGGRRGGGSMLFIHLDPTGMNPDGKVADLTLTYRLPGSAQVVAQTITLTYSNDPNDTPEIPYLSAPEMANRFAMYNMFLGFRAAVQNANYNCGEVTLRELKASATAWNATHEDPDIAADLTLIDLYLANLATHGATAPAEATDQSCQGYGTGSDGYGSNDDGWGHDGYQNTYACSAGRAGGQGMIVIGLGFLVALRRRRR
jgi:Ca-activated chloride channel family protein